MSCKDNKDGSCSVEYIPFTPGEYDVNITFGGLPIPGGVFIPSFYQGPVASHFALSGRIQGNEMANDVRVLQGAHFGFRYESWWIPVK